MGKNIVVSKREVTYGPPSNITRGEQHRRRQALINRSRVTQPTAQQSVQRTGGILSVILGLFRQKPTRR
jgi:hypothetical protein